MSAVLDAIKAHEEYFKRETLTERLILLDKNQKLEIKEGDYVAQRVIYGELVTIVLRKAL